MSDEVREKQVSAAMKRLQIQTEVAYKEFDNLLGSIGSVLNPGTLEVGGPAVLSEVRVTQCELAEKIMDIVSQLQNLTNKIVFTNGRIEL